MNKFVIAILIAPLFYFADVPSDFGSFGIAVHILVRVAILIFMLHIIAKFTYRLTKYIFG